MSGRILPDNNLKKTKKHPPDAGKVQDFHSCVLGQPGKQKNT
jgi:hypothetical protein